MGDEVALHLDSLLRLLTGVRLCQNSVNVHLRFVCFIVSKLYLLRRNTCKQISKSGYTQQYLGGVVIAEICFEMHPKSKMD